MQDETSPWTGFGIKKNFCKFMTRAKEREDKFRHSISKSQAEEGDGTVREREGQP